MTAARLVTVDLRRDEPRWDSFVRAQELSTAYHLGAWARILPGAYGYRATYLALQNAAGELQATMPLFFGRGLLTKARLSSMPVARVAGPVGGSRSDHTALLGHACIQADELGVKRLLVRSTTEGYERDVPNLTRAPDQPTWRTDLPGNHEDLRAQVRSSSKNVARSIAKAEKAGVTVRIGDSPADLRRFYALYLKTMRRHGSLPRSFGQLALARKHLGPHVFKLFVAEREGAIVAGGVFHSFRDTLELLYNASEPEAQQHAPNFALYFEAMRWAIDAGLRRFDFGGALEQTSLGEFKRKWGAQPVPIWQYEYLTDRSAHPGNGPSTDGSGGSSRLAPILQRSPLTLTRLMGTAAYRFV